MKFFDPFIVTSYELADLLGSHHIHQFVQKIDEYNARYSLRVHYQTFYAKPIYSINSHFDNWNDQIHASAQSIVDALLEINKNLNSSSLIDNWIKGLLYSLSTESQYEVNYLLGRLDNQLFLEKTILGTQWGNKYLWSTEIEREIYSNFILPLLLRLIGQLIISSQDRLQKLWHLQQLLDIEIKIYRYKYDYLLFNLASTVRDAILSKHFTSEFEQKFIAQLFFEGDLNIDEIKELTGKDLVEIEYTIKKYQNHIIPEAAKLCLEHMDFKPNDFFTLKNITPILSLRSIRNFSHDYESMSILFLESLFEAHYQYSKNAKRCENITFQIKNDLPQLRLVNNKDVIYGIDIMLCNNLLKVIKEQSDLIPIISREEFIKNLHEEIKNLGLEPKLVKKAIAEMNKAFSLTGKQTYLRIKKAKEVTLLLEETELILKKAKGQSASTICRAIKYSFTQGSHVHIFFNEHEEEFYRFKHEIAERLTVSKVLKLLNQNPNKFSRIGHNYWVLKDTNESLEYSLRSMVTDLLKASLTPVHISKIAETIRTKRPINERSLWSNLKSARSEFIFFNCAYIGLTSIEYDTFWHELPQVNGRHFHESELPAGWINIGIPMTAKIINQRHGYPIEHVMHVLKQKLAEKGRH